MNKFPKLSETFVLNQITGLIQRGYEVRVFSREPGEEGAQHPDINEYGLVDKTVYYGDDVVEAPKGKVHRASYWMSRDSRRWVGATPLS